MRLFRIALATSLTLSALLFFAWTWHWPLVGDASLIHYLVFLIERGWAPYRDFGDMEMPGTYLIELAAMHLFGAGALAWRLFDFTLLGIAAASFFVITRRVERDRSACTLASLFAACLFALIHGRDGLAQTGQRDLTMAVLLLAATACLFLAVRRAASADGDSWPAAAFGLLSGLAVTIKPTALPFTIAQLLLAACALRRFFAACPARNQASYVRWSPTRIVLLRYVAPAALAWVLAPLFTLLFLSREHALPAFLAIFRGVLPYYASLGHRTFGYLLLHSVSPLLPLVLAWLAVLALDRTLLRSTLDWSRDWERSALLLGVLFGLVSCVVQARALPYHRYPLLAFLLPLMALDCFAVLEPAVLPHPRVRLAKLLALATLALGALFLAPQSAVLIHRDRWWQTDFNTSLEQDLNALGGPALSGRIQCIDSVSGCGNVLYLMRLEPASGVLLDFLLFGPSSVPIVRDTRAQFTRDLQSNPPQVLVVTSPLYLGGLEDFRKLDRWPAFIDYLAANYTLRTQWNPTRTNRWWSREEYPPSYRIYVLRASGTTSQNQGAGTTSLDHREEGVSLKKQPRTNPVTPPTKPTTRRRILEPMRMTVLASGSKGNSTVIASSRTRILVDAGLSCRELLKRMAQANEDPTQLDAILITHEHQDHVAGLSVLARRLNIPVFFTEPTHRAWVRMLTPRTTMTYAQWLDRVQQEKLARAEAAAQATTEPGAPSMAVSSPWVGSDATTSNSGPLQLEAGAAIDDEEDETTPTTKADPTCLPAVEYFQSGTNFSIGDISITPFTIPHDAADPCGFVFESHSEAIRMAIATDLGYFPPNVKSALKRVDVLLLESNHDLEMLKDGPYPWSVKQRVLSRVGHLSNDATADFLARDYDGGAAWIVLGHLSESNNAPELALLAAEQAIAGRMTLLGNRVLLASQSAPLTPICL